MILRPDIFVEDILNGDKIQQFSRRTVALQEICVKKGRKAISPIQTIGPEATSLT